MSECAAATTDYQFVVVDEKRCQFLV